MRPHCRITPYALVTKTKIWCIKSNMKIHWIWKTYRILPFHISSKWNNWLSTRVKARIGWSLNYHICNFFGLHTNVKFKAIFKINIVNFLIIHVVIDFNGIIIKKNGWILRRLWIHNGLLKWQHCVYHIGKIKNVDSKKMSK
jgi:hypothetical protein